MNKCIHCGKRATPWGGRFDKAWQYTCPACKKKMQASRFGRGSGLLMGLTVILVARFLENLFSPGFLSWLAGWANPWEAAALNTLGDIVVWGLTFYLVLAAYVGWFCRFTPLPEQEGVTGRVEGQ
jgi:hypothetical protein